MGFRGRFFFLSLRFSGLADFAAVLVVGVVEGMPGEHLGASTDGSLLD
jgi:hypothetical protein